MKKLLATLLVLAMCAPAMALTFSLDGADGVLTINYNLAAGEGLRGLALTVTNVSGNGVANGTFTASQFNTFIDYAYSNPADYDINDGHPFALTTGAGVATLPAASFALSMGYLDQAGNQAAITTSGSITVDFDLSQDTVVTVALDTLRGGAVGDALTVDDAGLGNVTIEGAPVIQYTLTTASAGNGTANGAGVFDQGVVAPINGIANAGYYFWKWTGDVANVANVNAASTTITMNANAAVTANFTLACQKYNVTKEVGGTDNICNVNDLNALIAWVNAKKNNPAIFAVPSSDPDYNVPVAGTTYGLVYNITKKEGGTDNTVNVNDLNSLINYVNKRKAALFSVNCATCGC